MTEYSGARGGKSATNTSANIAPTATPKLKSRAKSNIIKWLVYHRTSNAVPHSVASPQTAQCKALSSFFHARYLCRFVMSCRNEKYVYVPINNNGSVIHGKMLCKRQNGKRDKINEEIHCERAVGTNKKLSYPIVPW